ncbi:MAG: LytTR family DNA-binding domain-containing protein [Pseudomonadota bacterium]
MYLYGEILVVSAPLVAAYVAISRRGSGAVTPTAATGATATPAPPFLARVPARLGRDLLCLQMEDHYVRLHTALGSDMILMRMRDAVGELEGLPGLQVHRSWWVARAAVTGHAVEGRRLSLRLSNGMVVPVARDVAPRVRAAGWLDR